MLVWLIAPLAVGSAILVVALWNQAQAKVEKELQAWSNSNVDVIEHRLSRARVQLEAIAALPDLDRGDLGEVHRFARGVIADNPGTLVVLVRADGQVLINTSVPFGTSLPNLWQAEEQPTKTDQQGHEIPFGPPALPREVFRDGRVTYSDLFLGRNISGPRMAIGIPVRRNGVVLYALRLSYPVDDLSRLLRGAGLPDQARAVLLDRRGTVIANNGISPYAIADKLLLPASRTAVQELLEPDGTTTAAAYGRTSGGYTVLVSFPRAVAYRTAREAAILWALFAAGTLLLSVYGAARLNRRVAEPLQRLAEDALASKPPRVTEISNIHEIDLLAGALRTAAENDTARRKEHIRLIEAEKREEAVEASEKQMRRIFAGLHVSVAVLDTDGRLTELNHLPVQRADIGRSDVLGRLFWDCYSWSYDPAVQRTLRESVAEACQGRDAIRYNMPVRVDEGRFVMVDLQLSPLRHENGAVTQLIACTVDVQDRVDAIKSLQAREAEAREIARKLDEQRWLLDAALEATPAGILVSDRRGRLLRANQANQRLWGGTPPASFDDACAGLKGWWSQGQERQGQAVQPSEWPLSRALKSATPESSVIDIQPFDAPEVRKTVQISAAPVLDEVGTVVGGVAVQMDITDRVRAEVALREADRHKDEFMATLGHELRNPLGPIRSAIHILRKYPTAEPVLNRAQEVIERQTKHMTHLVDDLLDMARITKGSLRMEQETVDLQDVAAAAIEAVSAAFQAKGVRFLQDLAPEPLYVKGDATRLSQALINLLTNACKFTKVGGQVILRLRSENAAALVEVADTGIGLAPDSLERIFGLFVQERPSGAAGNNGLGIGLALSRRLLAMHGGELRAASAGLGKGSTFTARVPLVDEPVEMAVPSIRTRGERRRSRQRVLVVDDNHDAGDLLKELLQISGYDVDTAYNGATALAAAQKTLHNAFVLDIGLPDMNGYELCRRLRVQVGAVPVIIALTGWGQPEDKKAAMEAGFDTHVTKPADPDVLSKALETFLKARERATNHHTHEVSLFIKTTGHDGMGHPSQEQTNAAGDRNPA